MADEPDFSFDSPDGTSGAGGNNPVNDSTGAGKAIDPASLVPGVNNDGTGGPSGRKQRSDKGQPRGSRKSSGTQTSKAPLDINFVEFLLVSAHAAVASATKIQEAEITTDEAHRLALSIQHVSTYYPVAIDPKTQAWIALIMCAGGIYGSRAISYVARMNAEKNAAPANASTGPDVLTPQAHVTPIRAV